MASTNVTNFKVFLRDDDNTEARRFTVDPSVVTSFLFMKEKIQAVFPVLRDTNFKITWKDADGDEITITGDEDLITAFTEMSGSVKVLYVTVINRNHKQAFFNDAEPQDASHFGQRIICDVCDQSITGFRYKCLQCPDYDLCGRCEHQGLHSEHLMMRMPNNEVYMPKCARKMMHHFSRTLKKSAHHAGKEAHRAAKIASRFGSIYKPADEGRKAQQSQTQAGTSTQNAEGQKGCPFSAGEGINMNDIHALGAYARQHIGPILEAFQPESPSEQSTNNNPDQGGLFLDMIRNAVDGFFGRVPEAEEEQRDDQNEKQATEKTNTKEQTTPMDVEGTQNNVPNVPPPSKTNPSVENPEKRDPGWTFVATNPSQPNENSATNAQNEQPTAPFLVYHENPVIVQGLIRLYEMGFSNQDGSLTRLLERYEGNVSAVVKAIIDMNN